MNNKDNKPTLDKVIDSDEFKRLLNNRVQSYLMRPLPQTGLRYKRTPYDYLIDNGLFTVEGIIGEFRKIVEHKSSMSKSVRDCISITIGGTYIDLMKKLEKQEQDGK